MRAGEIRQRVINALESSDDVEDCAAKLERFLKNRYSIAIYDNRTGNCNVHYDEDYLYLEGHNLDIQIWQGS